VFCSFNHAEDRDMTTTSVPTHVAIIMDGNGRWGERHGKRRSHGHIAGAENVRSIVKAAGNLGVEVLTLWAFSTENWKREGYEVDVLMWLFRRYIRRETKQLKETGVRVTFVGRRSALPQLLQQHMAKLEAVTASNDKLWLRIALNFSGTQAAVDAAERLFARGEPLTDDAFVREQLEGAPPYDLVIRTSGELRTSDFPVGHAELYFSEKLWPEFSRPDLEAALRAYSVRDRRKGAATSVPMAP
jgi:undecaprenyl diphosphate synthase